MAPTPPSPILSVSLKEGARLLGISLNSIRRHAAAGRIRTVQLGRRRLVPVDGLLELIRSQESKERRPTPLFGERRIPGEF
jgi:excisionase family DNA binding protein